MSILFEQAWRGELAERQDFFRSALMTGCQDFLHGLTFWKGLSGVQDGAQSLSYCIQRVHSHSLRSRDELGCSARLGHRVALKRTRRPQGATWKSILPKTAGGSLGAIIRHNCRIPCLAITDARVGAISDAEASSGQERSAVPEAEMSRKDNIDPHRIGLDQVRFNPACGHGDGSRVSLHDLPVALNAEPELPVMDALQGLLGIEDIDCVLRNGVGRGDCGGRRPKPVACTKSKRRRKARKAVRQDAVLAVDVILQASSSFFFHKIRKEEWTQERIEKSLFGERGELDLGAVEAFRDAWHSWAKDRWGEEGIAEVALHFDESCPHMHIVLIPEQNGWLNVVKCLVDSSADARGMLDAMKPFF